MIPEDLYYSEEHEWVRIDDEILTVGITDYAQEQLGDIVYVELPEVGDTVEAGSTVGELESTKSVSDIFNPVAGQVIARNEGLDGGEEVINADPYGEGWLFKVRASVEDPTSGLLTAEQYVAITSG